jgi:hypothetical protein
LTGGGLPSRFTTKKAAIGPYSVEKEKGSVAILRASVIGLLVFAHQPALEIHRKYSTKMSQLRLQISHQIDNN